MNKKKILTIIITIVVVLALVLFHGVYLIRENYRLGQEMYTAVNDMSVHSYQIAYNIGYLEEKFESGDIDDIASHTHGFENAILEVHSCFGYDDIPILEDVRSEYIDRFEEIFRQIANDYDYKRLKQLFTDAEKSEDLDALKNKLEIMTDAFTDFRDRYNAMSERERYLTSWSEEREILSEKVRLSE